MSQSLSLISIRYEEGALCRCKRAWKVTQEIVLSNVLSSSHEVKKIIFAMLRFVGTHYKNQPNSGTLL